MTSQAANAVRKMMSSGAVTVTGPTPTRMLKQQQKTIPITISTTTSNSLQQYNNTTRCYVCDDAVGGNTPKHFLTELKTTQTGTKFPQRIAQMVGEGYMVIICVEDIICTRCMNLVNYCDRSDGDVDRVKANFMNLLNKKYSLFDDPPNSLAAPPSKMQKLNSGISIRSSPDDSSDLIRPRKVVQAADASLGKQSPPVSAVQQIKISTPTTMTGPQTTTHGTATIQRKTTKIYKCLSCDYKTSDMRLFNSHYETCKQQNFQCKNCKKIFPNFGTMKHHMVRDHNTAMDHTCAVCHINLINEMSLRKHMETNHATNVVVTSTATLPAGATVSTAEQVNNSSATSLYSCNHCQFKSTDKAVFDEHLRKHLSGVKPKPFKCRLCAQRFETREAATIHAKQHQPNYFKCGTCSMSFPKRELLVKHFEVHHPQQQHQTNATTTTTTAAVAQHQQTATNQQVTIKQSHNQQHNTSVQMTTQKLLQDTIDEALGDNISTTGAANNADIATAGANNIRFFSCQMCSLTFIQETYYNQHMETHRRDKKGVNVGGTGSGQQQGSMSSLNSAATALLSDGGMTNTGKGSGSGSGASIDGSAGQQSNALDADIESIFEKMHSDKGNNSGRDNLVITSQEGSGGITFNITLPQPDGNQQAISEASKTTPTTTGPVSVSIDMPMLDQPDDAAGTVPKIEKDMKVESNGHGGGKTAPVSMPSLDDDNDSELHQSAGGGSSATVNHTGAKRSADTKKSDDKSNIKVEHDVKEEPEDRSGGNTGSNANAEVSQNAETSEGVGSGGEEQAATAGSGGEGAGDSDQLNSSAGDQQQQVTMELDEAMQAQVESGQIKFILNENGQLLQLNDHIITDADGNQILVQDPEQIQQLLQSVGVLQSGEGLDGETLQMMTDANGTQMVLVQGENNETQLIDASLLNADGQLVIQQGHDGDLGEGAHVIGEDGTRIPVSVSYTADGQPIVQVQQQVLDASEEGVQHIMDKDASVTNAVGENAVQQAADAAGGNGSGAGGASSGGGSYFALEDLMQQSSGAKAAE